jgi:ABC-2 type transport system permease protein
MQLARYPIGIYPGWLQFVLTWIIPVAIMTTIPAGALTGDIQPIVLVGAVVVSIVLFVAASALFRFGVRRYNSASS